MMKKFSQSIFNLRVCLALLICLCLACKNPKYETEYAEKQIKENSKLQKLDDICKQVPIPTNFNFINKNLTWIKDKEPLITYFYNSDNAFEKSDKFFSTHLSKNGWKIENRSHLNYVRVFSKDIYEINIQFGGMRDANHAIGCSIAKLDSSKK